MGVPGHFCRPKVLTHTDSQTLTRVKVNDSQQTEPATVKQRVRDKIHAPDVVRPETLRLWLAFQCGFIAARTFKPKRQSLLTVEPINALMIIVPALPLQQDMHPAVTIVNTGFGDLLYAQAQRTVVCRN